MPPPPNHDRTALTHHSSAPLHLPFPTFTATSSRHHYHTITLSTLSTLTRTLLLPWPCHDYLPASPCPESHIPCSEFATSTVRIHLQVAVDTIPFTHSSLSTLSPSTLQLFFFATPPSMYHYTILRTISHRIHYIRSPCIARPFATKYIQGSLPKPYLYDPETIATSSSCFLMLQRRYRALLSITFYIHSFLLRPSQRTPFDHRSISSYYPTIFYRFVLRPSTALNRHI